MRFEKGHEAWNKGMRSSTKKCPLCGVFLSDKKEHVCRNVELKGNRYCKECGVLLKNTGHERYSKICDRCGKIIQRQNEKKLRAFLIDKFGGKCEVCRYNKAKECLEFHHKNKEDKKSKHFLKQILNFPERFMLLCNRCHREVEFGYIRVI
jgi:acetyl-CoA carboxylase beta subunit